MESARRSSTEAATEMVIDFRVKRIVKKFVVVQVIEIIFKLNLCKYLILCSISKLNITIVRFVKQEVF
ncbi:unnamed protein product [Rodentolepis nana]|uniref:Uncharacterized protein n=1 Tax=Rodentolepis nana TaxID=102285 RepID=A0A0R3TY75_RODNA|nr:unnamed protein product [Rodentolepis nana]